jgi:transposase InsO family protein
VPEDQTADEVFAVRKQSPGEISDYCFKVTTDFSVNISTVVSAEDPSRAEHGVYAFVDSGSGCTYILSGGGWLPKRSVSRYIAMADSTTCEITEATQVRLKILPSHELSEPEDVYYMPGGDPDGPLKLLIGCGLASKLRLMLDFETGEVLRGNEVVSSPDHGVRYVTLMNKTCSVSPQDGSKPQGTTAIPVPPRSEDYIRPAESKERSAEVADLLERVIAKGWRYPPLMPGFAICFKHLNPYEVKDVDEQVAAAYLKVPTLHLSEGARRYSHSSFKRLTPEKQSLFKDLANVYYSANWWHHPRSVPDHMKNWPTAGPVNVFMVNQDTKPRLVIDPRGENKRWPQVSSSDKAVWKQLAVLRVTPITVLMLGDACQAFYRVRLHEQLFLLLVGLSQALSDRMLFGLSCGPCGLDESLGYLFEEVRKSMSLFSLVMLLIFVDDFAVGGVQVADVAKVFTFSLSLMLRAGFGVMSKKIAVLAAPPIVEEVKSELEKYGMTEVQVETSKKHLGVTLYFEESCLTLSCDRSSRLASVREWASGEGATRFSKRSVFKAAGQLAYDAMMGHPVERLLGDTLRQLVGRKLADKGWDDKVEVSALGPLTQVYADLLKWIVEVCADNKCQHRSASDISSLRVRCDASLIGGAFSIVSADGVRIVESAWRWSGREIVHHVNRKELFALAQGLKHACLIVEAQQGATVKSEAGVKNVVIECDSRSAVSWAKEPRITKSLEARAVKRLANGAREDVQFLKDLGVAVSIEHVSGESNIRCDELSRLLERDGIGKALIEYLEPNSTVAELVEEIVGKAELVDFQGVEDPGIDFCEYREALMYICTFPVDTVAKVCPVKSTSLANRTAMDCYDIETLKYRLLVAQWVLRTWSSLAKFEAKSRQKRKAKTLAPVVTSPFPSEGDGVEGIGLMGLSCQYEELQLDLKRLPRDSVQKDTSGVLWYRALEPSGHERWLLYIPASNPSVVAVLVRDEHRRSNHSGGRRSVADKVALAGFFSPITKKVADSVLTSCLTCQQLAAQRVWSLPPGLSGMTDEEWTLDQLAKMPPYTGVAVDVKTCGTTSRGIKFLTVQCLSTRHVSWCPVDAEDGETLAVAFTRVRNREGLMLRVLADQGPGFRSGAFAEGIKPSKLVLINSRSPWVHGIEAHHRLANRIFETLCVGTKRLTELSPIARQDLADKVVNLLNSRPLGSCVERSDGAGGVRIIPVTPDHLRYGYNKSPWQLPYCSGDSFDVATERDKVMKNFISNLWPELRTGVSGRTGRNFTDQSPLSLQSGDRALVWTGGRKFGICTVISGVESRTGGPPRRYQVLMQGSRPGVREVNHFNLRPLRMESDCQAAPTVTWVGARRRVFVGKFEAWFTGTVVLDRGCKVFVAWDIAPPGSAAAEWLQTDSVLWGPCRGSVAARNL